MPPKADLLIRLRESRCPLDRIVSILSIHCILSTIARQIIDPVGCMGTPNILKNTDVSSLRHESCNSTVPVTALVVGRARN